MVRRQQSRGFARLSLYVTRLTHLGFDAAHGRAGPEERLIPEGAEPLLTGSVGVAFSEDADFDELDDLGHRSGRDRFGRRHRTGALSTSRSRLVTWVVVAVLLVVGTRELLFGSFPLVGQLVPLQGWSATWQHFVSGWQPAGVGTTAPATPAYAALGLVGTVLLGGMGLTQKVLVLGCIPIGAWGVVALLRPLASARGRLVAGVAYLGLPLAYDALGMARWDGLVAYAAVPWIVLLLARATGLRPFARRCRHGLAGQQTRADRWCSDWWRRWRPAVAPAVVPVVLVVGVMLLLGSFVVGGWEQALRGLGVAVAATLVAARAVPALGRRHVARRRGLDRDLRAPPPRGRPHRGGEACCASPPGRSVPRPSAGCSRWPRCCRC